MENEARSRLATAGLLQEFGIGWDRVPLAPQDLRGLSCSDLPPRVTAIVETVLPGNKPWSRISMHFQIDEDNRLLAGIVRTCENRLWGADEVSAHTELIAAAIRGHERAGEFEDDYFGDTISYRLTLSSQWLEDAFAEVMRFELRMHRAIMSALRGSNADVH